MFAMGTTVVRRRRRHPEPPPTLALIFPILFLVTSPVSWYSPAAVHAWQIAASFQAISPAGKGVLSAAHVLVPPALSSDACSSPSGRGVGAGDGEGSLLGQRNLLATAGHDGGTVRLWDWDGPHLPSRPRRRADRSSDARPAADASDLRRPPSSRSFDVHGGSIFSLSSSSTLRGFSGGGSLLASGSFDRSAALHRIVAARAYPEDDGGATAVENAKDEAGASSELNAMGSIGMESLGSLRDHTGWVRDVAVVHPATVTNGGVSADDDCNIDMKEIREEGGGRYLLSIGCNFINVCWTAAIEDEGGGEGTMVAKRLARLDSGPSPGDDPTEDGFRRHDILTFAVGGGDGGRGGNSEVGGASMPRYVVAGLVDGTLRAFESQWESWLSRRLQSDENSGEERYEDSGSCAAVEGLDDDSPVAAVRAHEGRVTGVHALKRHDGVQNSFVSVGYDGGWKVWRLIESKQGLDNEGEGRVSFVKVSSGNIGCHHGDKNCEQQKGHRNSNDMRICSSLLAPNTVLSATALRQNLMLGTIGGGLYCVVLRLSHLGEWQGEDCAHVWNEEEAVGAGDKIKKHAITALASMPLPDANWLGKGGNSGNKSTRVEHRGKDIVVVAGTSEGIVRIFVP